MAIQLYQGIERAFFARKLTGFDLVMPNSNRLFFDYGYSDRAPADQTRLEINYYGGQGFQPIMAVDANPRGIRFAQDGYKSIVYDREEENFLIENTHVRIIPENQQLLDRSDSPYRAQFNPKGRIKLTSSYPQDKEDLRFIELDPRNGEYTSHDNQDSARIYVGKRDDINYHYANPSFAIAGNDREVLIGLPLLNRQMLLERDGNGYRGLALSPNDTALDIRRASPDGLIEYFNYHGDESVFERLKVDRDAVSYDSSLRRQQAQVWGYKDGRYRFNDYSSKMNTTSVSGEMDLIDGSMSTYIRFNHGVFSIHSQIYP